MKKLLLTALLLPTLALAEDITIQNLVRAESDTMFRMTMKGKEHRHRRDRSIARGHLRRRCADGDPANQDTLYSVAIVDLSTPVTVTLPEGDGRFQSVLVISQDHYSFAYAKPGAYKLTEEEVGTRFAMLLFRTFVDAGDPDDAARAHAVQDGITSRAAEGAIRGAGLGP
jgi:hypothetical protein